MTTKPDDIPKDVWDDAYNIFSELESPCLDYRDTDKAYRDAKKSDMALIARAILSAQSQAYIDAARIAAEYRGPNGRFERDEPDKTVYGWGTARRAISAAILQRKEEIGLETERIQSKVGG